MKCSLGISNFLEEIFSLSHSVVFLYFIKGRGTRDQIADICWTMEKARVPEKLLYWLLTIAISALLTMTKPLTVWITINCEKFLETGILDHLTCLLRNLYAGQEATVRIRHGRTDWFKIEKGVCQGCILSLCLFNFYFMWNAELESRLLGEISIISDM